VQPLPEVIDVRANPFSDAFETDADLTLCGLSEEQSMPAALITLFIHIAI
jgi:hypothetical protein